MTACDQATKQDNLRSMMTELFPTAKSVNIKIVDIDTGLRPTRSYIHSNVNCDLYTDGMVLNTKRGKEVIDFSRAYFIERDEKDNPLDVTAVFRHDQYHLLNTETLQYCNSVF